MIKNIDINNYDYIDSNIQITIKGKIKDNNAFIRDLTDLLKKHEVESNRKW